MKNLGSHLILASERENELNQIMLDSRGTTTLLVPTAHKYLKFMTPGGKPQLPWAITVINEGNLLSRGPHV